MSRFVFMRSFGLSYMARVYYKRYCHNFGFTIPEKAPSFSLVVINQGTSKNQSCLNFFHKAVLALFVSGTYTWARSITKSSVECQEFKMENIDEPTLNTQTLKPLEMNEVAALTHGSLLRQASGVAVDAALQLLNRSLRATLDFSAQYRKQLNELIDLLEFCTATLRNPEQHDSMWELLVAARSHTDSLKQQLKDLAILISYAYVMVENAGMTAYMSGVEFTATTAQQAVTNVKCELENDARQNHALEVQYMYAHTRYIEASQRLAEEQERNSQNNSLQKEGEGEEQEEQGASAC